MFRAGKRTFSTPRNQLRGLFVLILLLALGTGVYNQPRYYNDAARWANERLDQTASIATPSWLNIKGLANLNIPELQPREFRLGLDLVGGTELLYDADTSKISEIEKSSALEGVRDVIERRVNAFGVAEPLVQTDRSGDNSRVLVQLAGIQNVDEAIKQIGETPLLEFKEPDSATEPPPELTEDQQDQIIASEVIARQSANDVLARLRRGEDFAALAAEFSGDPGSKDQGGEIDWMPKGALVPEYEKAIFTDLKVNELTPQPIKTDFGYHIIQKLEERGSGDEQEVRSRHILFLTMSARDFLPASSNEGWKNTELSGKQLERAAVVFDPQTNAPQVQLTFNSEGAKLFEDVTRRNVGQAIAIFLDNQAISVPRVNEPITGGQAVITGDFTVEEAKLLTQRLNAGALPVPITLVSQQRVGASLGESAIAQSLRAGLYGFLLVALFLILYYRLPGLIAVLALIIYVSITLAIYKFWPVTLTLAGIAGFILSIGMAVDANVLIFERLKEELRRGRSLSVAMTEGFRRAWTSIRDSNASSLITCFILGWFGSSVVKGFALTLAIGIVVSMFSAITITRTFMRLVIGNRNPENLWWFGVGRKSISEEVSGDRV